MPHPRRRGEALRSTADTGGWLDRLRGVSGLTVSRDVPLARRTSFGIGGPARVLALASTPDAVVEICRIAAQAQVAVTVLGGGTNLLVADGGVEGIVIELDDSFAYAREIAADATRVTWEIGAAYHVAKLVRAAVEQGLGGPEVLAGVPGRLGGALVMNAGGRDGSVARMVARVRLATAAGVRWLDAAQAGFDYRTSRFPAGSVLLGAELALVRTDREALAAKVGESRARRRATQPLSLRSAGSIFRNPPGAFAGQLIEAAGCKGWREGGAEVSELHANFIVNRGRATAHDVLRLVERVRARVLERTGVSLELELRLLGRFDGREEGRPT